MWFNLSTVSGKHYQFKVNGFPTRYYHGQFQVFVSSLSELTRMAKFFDCAVAIGNSQLVILDKCCRYELEEAL